MPPIPVLRLPLGARRSLRCWLAPLAVFAAATCGGGEPTGPGVGSMTGEVVSSLGGGIGGVTVVLTPRSGNVAVQVVTVADGHFSAARVPAGTGTITVQHLPANCGPAAPLPYTVTAGVAASAHLEVPCQPVVGTIIGHVVSDRGVPLDSAPILVKPDTSATYLHGRSTSTGAYVVTGVPAGSGSVTASVQVGSCTASAPVAYTGLGFHDTLQVDLTVPCDPPTGWLSGTVHNSLGGVLTGVTVTLAPDSGGPASTSTTDLEGRYGFAPVPVDSGTLSVTGGLPAECVAPTPVVYRDLTLNSVRTVDLTVPCALGTITGTVTSSLFGPLVDATVTVRPATDFPRPSVHTDSAGMYTVTRVALGDGTVTVAASGNPVGGYCFETTTAYQGLARGEQRTINLRVVCTGVLEVTVRDTATQTFVDAVVAVSVDGPAGPRTDSVWNHGGAPVEFGMLPADSGTIRISHLPTGCTPPADTPFHGLTQTLVLRTEVPVACGP